MSGNPVDSHAIPLKCSKSTRSPVIYTAANHRLASPIQAAEHAGEAMGPANKKRPRDGEQSELVRTNKRLRTSTLINTPPSQNLDVYVFGTCAYSELGLGPSERPGKNPKRAIYPRLNDLLDSKSVGVTQIAVGGMHCVALTHDNQIYTWGVNDDGALGRETQKASSEDSDSDEDGLDPAEATPTPISLTHFQGHPVFSQVAATDNASFALTSEGAVYGWGTFLVCITFIKLV